MSFIESPVTVGSPVATTYTSYIVTAEFPANQVIILTTGNGSSGTSTKSGSNPLLPALSANFVGNGSVDVLRNGVSAVKGINCIWDSTTSLHFTHILQVGDYFVVKAPSSY